MDGAKKEIAARNMINTLHECGYLDDRDKNTLEYKLKTGDLAVFEEIRAFLLKIADEITK